MILPLITPGDGVVFNLLQLVHLKLISDEMVEATFTGGVKKVFTGDAAKIVRGEIIFAVNTYRQFQIEVQKGSNGGSLIVPPDFSGGPVN